MPVVNFYCPILLSHFISDGKWKPFDFAVLYTQRVAEWDDNKSEKKVISSKAIEMISSFSASGVAVFKYFVLIEEKAR